MESRNLKNNMVQPAAQKVFKIFEGPTLCMENSYSAFYLCVEETEDVEKLVVTKGESESFLDKWRRGRSYPNSNKVKSSY